MSNSDFWRRLAPSATLLLGLGLITGLTLSPEQSADGLHSWTPGGTVMVGWTWGWTPLSLGLAALVAALSLVVVWRDSDEAGSRHWPTIIQALLFCLQLGLENLVLKGAVFLGLGLAVTWAPAAGGRGGQIGAASRFAAAWEWLGGAVLFFVLAILGLYARGSSATGIGLTFDAVRTWAQRPEAGPLHAQTLSLISGAFLAAAMIRAVTLASLPALLSRWGRLSLASWFAVAVAGLSFFWWTAQWRSLSLWGGALTPWVFWIPTVVAVLGILRGLLKALSGELVAVAVRRLPKGES